MKYQLAYAPYYLTTLLGQQKSGVFLRLQGIAGEVGYSSLFSWPEFGDPTIEECIRNVSTYKENELLQKSLYLAELDLKSERLDEGYLANHFHYNEELIPKEFGVAKRKISPEIQHWPEWDGVWRLDANNRFEDAASFLRFWEKIPVHVKKNVQFVEDPCPFKPQEWSKLEGIPLAWDWQFASPLEHRSLFDVYVYKPARDMMNKIDWELFDKEILVTSYLDHPLGQMTALHEAIQLKMRLGSRILDAGLITNNVYIESNYSKKLKIVGNRLYALEGNGWGFGDLLNQENWLQLGEVKLD